MAFIPIRKAEYSGPAAIRPRSPTRICPRFSRRRRSSCRTTSWRCWCATSAMSSPEITRREKAVDRRRAPRPRARTRSAIEAWARSRARCRVRGDRQQRRAGNATPQLNLGAYNIFQIVWGNPGFLTRKRCGSGCSQRPRPAGWSPTTGLTASGEPSRAVRRGRRRSRGCGRWRSWSSRRARREAAVSAWRRASASFGASSGAPLRRPGMRRVIQLIEGERHRVVDEAEEALIAAGGFDIYQRDAIMVRPVMDQLPARQPARHQAHHGGVAADAGEAALSDRDAGTGAPSSRATTGGARTGSTRTAPT